MAARILPLPEEVRSQLRSGVAIASVAQCVEELVLNSLDAGATCVAVRIDLSIFMIQVVDNGDGVPQTDLKYLGRRHATSKCRSLTDLSTNLCHYGFRGEALASIINLSAIVDITTRPKGTPRTLTKLFTFGKERSVSTARINRPCAGTTITIQEFMHNMPVRQKLVREAIDLESVRMRLESFALMHSKVAFSLRNDRTNFMVIQTKKSSGTLATFLQLFGLEKAQGMAEVHHSLGHFTISGYIGTQPHLTKALQFVYINKRLVRKTKIHKMLNDLLARSSIISTRLHPSSVGPSKTPSSPPKGMRLYGMFVLNIECPYSEYDICLDPTKTLVEFKDWNQLLLCIEELVLQFAHEEDLVISLDERFRRSGRDREEGEEEEKLSMSQSSQSRLQVFSLKRSCEGDKEDEGPGLAKEKYGRMLNTQDNLLAVHSVMVKRIRKEPKVSEDDKEKNCTIDKHNNNKEATEKCSDKKDNASDPPQNDDDSILGAMKNKDEKYCEDSSDDGEESRNIRMHQKDTQSDSSRCVEGTTGDVQESPSKGQEKHKSKLSPPPTKFEELPISEKNSSENKHVTESSESEEAVCLAAKRREGVRSVLEEFKKVLEKVNEKDDNTESDLDQALALAEKSSHQEWRGRNRDRNRDRIKGNTSTLSTLEEFMNFHNREQEENVLDGYQTPEGDVRGTPTTPPPLKSPHPSLPPSAENDVLIPETHTRRMQRSSPGTESQRECDFDSRIRKTTELGYEGHAEKKVTRASLGKHRDGKKLSLSKSLSEKLKTHQNMSRGLMSLQRFSYCKTKPTQNIGETHSVVTEKNVGGERSSLSNEMGNSVLGPVEVPKVNTHSEITEDNGDRECHDTSFKFEPVITKTFPEVDTCLSHVQSCRENDASLDNHSAADVHCRRIGKKDHNLVVSTSSKGGSSGNSVGGYCNSRVSILNQHTTTPRKSSALLHIAEDYASTPEDSDGSPEKPSTINTPVKVPLFPGFKENLSHPEGTSLRHPEASGVIFKAVNPTYKCTGPEYQNMTRQKSQINSTFVESEDSILLSESVTNIDRFQQTGALCEFPCRSDLFNENTSAVCEKNNSTRLVEKGETQFKVSENYLSPCVAFYSVPITQSFEVNDPVTQQEAHREAQELKEDLQKNVCLQASQGFTPSSIEPLGIQMPSSTMEGEPQVPACPPQMQEATDSVRVPSGSVEPEEVTGKEVPEQTPHPKRLKSLSQSNKNEMYLKNTLPLLSQTNMENISANVCRSLVPEVSIAPEDQPLPPLQEGVVSEVEEEKGSGPISQTSPNPFSESLHFSQLTLPDEGDTKASQNMNTLPASSSLSIGVPFILSSTGIQSSLSENSEQQTKQIPSCDITFQGEVIQIGNRKESQERSVETSLPERIHESDNSSSAVLEQTQKLPLDSLPPVQSVDITVEDPDICNPSKDPGLHKNPNSLEESSEPEVSLLYKESSSCQDLTHGLESSCQSTSRQTEITACETQTLPHDCRWQETVDKEGRTVYVDLQTGNSSYEPPEVKDGPVWTSSQPLGAPLPKIPLTHEPWYISRGKTQRDRDNFTLSHGFTELISWKKTIEMRKKSVRQASTESNTNITLGCSAAGDEGMKTTPSGMTQEVQEAIESLLEDYEADDDFVKWTEKPEAVLQEPAQPSEVAQICQMWKPPDFAMDAEVLNSAPESGIGPKSASGVRIYNMVHPCKFSQEMLQSCEVLGQLDHKFIACRLRYPNPEGSSGRVSQLVVLFDQHAVHERVRLETIIQENCETLDSGETVLSKSAVIPPLQLDLPEDEVRMMHAYSEKFNQRGLYFTRISPSRVLFQLIPSCLVPKEANEVRRKHCQTAGAIVESVVRDVCHTLHQTGGVLGLIPRPISHVFNSNACRGAIKFGDVLTTKECQDLITSLCSCQLPFQCAHGRPSVVPMVNLTHLASRTSKTTSKPNLRKLRQAMETGTVL